MIMKKFTEIKITRWSPGVNNWTISMFIGKNEYFQAIIKSCDLILYSKLWNQINILP